MPNRHGGQGGRRNQDDTRGFGGPGGVGGGNGEPESVSNWIGATPDEIGGFGTGGGNGEPESAKTAAAKIRKKSSAMLVRTIRMVTSSWGALQRKYSYARQGVKSRDVEIWMRFRRVGGKRLHEKKDPGSIPGPGHSTPNSRGRRGGF